MTLAEYVAHLDDIVNADAERTLITIERIRLEYLDQMDRQFADSTVTIESGQLCIDVAPIEGQTLIEIGEFPE